MDEIHRSQTFIFFLSVNSQRPSASHSCWHDVLCHDGLTVPSRNELGQSLPSFLKLPLLGIVTIFMRKVSNPKDNFFFVSWNQVYMTIQCVRVNTLLSHPITSPRFVIFQFFGDFFINSFVPFVGIRNNLPLATHCPVSSSNWSSLDDLLPQPFRTYMAWISWRQSEERSRLAVICSRALCLSPLQQSSHF